MYIYLLKLTLCTPMSSVTRRQFLSQELLCRVLEIGSRYIIRLKITKYSNSVNNISI